MHPPRCPPWLVLLLAVAWVGLEGKGPASSRCRALAAEDPPAQAASALRISAPLDQTIFPPDLAEPTFRWEDLGPADAWLVTVGSGTERCRSELLRGKEWTPSEAQWQAIRRFSLEEWTTLEVTGVRQAEPERVRSAARVSFRTSRDEVGAPIFYREVNLPFAEAVKDPTRIRWRLGSVSERKPAPIVLENLPVCGNCHSFSANGKILGMDVDYANDKGSYALTPVEERIVLDDAKIISWSDFRREDGTRTYGLLSQVSPDGRHVLSTVKDRSVFLARPDLEFSQLFFPVRGILAVYDREARTFRALAGADDPRYVQSNPVWSPDGQSVVFARGEAFQGKAESQEALLTDQERAAFLEGQKPFRFDLYRVPFNQGAGGKAEPLAGASANGSSNYFPKFSPDGKWIVFCRSRSFMLLQPDSELYLIPAAGGEARRLECNTPRMNSWHSWSPNGRWLVFSSKAAGPYTQLYLTHIDPQGRSSPPLRLERFTAPDRAANIPEFVAIAPDGIKEIRARFVNDLSFFRAGDAFLRAGDVAGAREAYQKALGLNPENVDAHYNLGLILSRMGDLEQGLAHLRRVLELDPKQVGAHANLGTFLERQRRFKEAAFHYAEAARLDPRDLPKVLAVARCLAAQGKLGEAIEQLRKAIALDPGSAVAHLKLGAALNRRGEYAQAGEALLRALVLDPQLTEAHAELGLACSRQQRYEQALAHYDKALELNARNVSALLGKADCLEGQQRYGEAQTLRHQAAETAPELPETRLALARDQLRQGEAGRALRHLNRALELQPDHLEVLCALSRLLSGCADEKFRDGARALKLAEQALQVGGEGDPEALDALAAGYAECGRYPEAIAAAGKALAAAQTLRRELAPEIQKRLERFRAGRPWRQEE